jgi:3-oxoacid CoA-transferase subunit A
MEKCILWNTFQADFAIVKAWKGDEAGNLVFKGRLETSIHGMEQQKITIAEVEELLPAGSLDPNEIHSRNTCK